MKISGMEERDIRNEKAFIHPEPGDFWWEMFCPYFIIVDVNEELDEYIVLSCIGGEDSFSRKDEKNSKITNMDGTWSFDYSKSMVVSKEWISKAIHYDTLPLKFVADVSRTDRNLRVVAEYLEFQKTIEENKKSKRLVELLEELKDDYGIDANSQVEMPKMWQDSW